MLTSAGGHGLAERETAGTTIGIGWPIIGNETGLGDGKTGLGDGITTPSRLICITGYIGMARVERDCVPRGVVVSSMGVNPVLA